MPKKLNSGTSRSGARRKKIRPPTKRSRDDTPESTSAKKFRSRSTSDSRRAKSQEPEFSGYRIVDFDLLFQKIMQCLRCPCGGEVSVKETSLQGLFSTFVFTCGQCKQTFSIDSCKKIGASSNAPEINRRFVYAARCLGNGLGGMETFCEVMDLPPPMQQTSYERIQDHLIRAQKSVATKSMNAAAALEKELTESRDITVSGDGSWNTRGRTALNGVASLIGAECDKVIDIDVRSKDCRGCLSWKGSTNTLEYEMWQQKHQEVCTKTHKNASGQMEAESVKTLFLRSEKERDVRYVNYVGDGDSSTFLTVQAAKPYDTPVVKTECVQHVQKRMGTRLRKRIAEKRKMSDGKTIGGKGRLTGNQVTNISGLYGKAIRDNPTSLEDMHDAVWAIYHHKRSTDSHPMHIFCDKKWCKFLQLAEQGKAAEYKHHGVEPVCMDAIKDIFEDLSKPDLLKRCLGSRSQNANENLNSLIWKFCPKTAYAGSATVESAAYEAVLIFNEGHAARLDVMRSLGLTPGYFARRAVRRKDQRRLSGAERKTGAATKEARTQRKHQQEEEKRQEDKAGPSYAAGEF